MPYTKTNWVDNVTAITAERLNNIENGIEDAHNFVPAGDGEVGEVLTKTENGVEWAAPEFTPTVVGEVLEL